MPKINFKKFLLPGIFIIVLIGGITILLLFPKTTHLFTEVEQDLLEKSDSLSEHPASLSPLASGKQTYAILTDQPKNPQIFEVEVDPLDVEIGKKQTITVKIKNDETDSITKADSVLVAVITDNKSTTIPLKLIKAEGEASLLTAWQGVWQRDDSFDFNYQLSIKAKNIKGENSVELTFK